MKFRCRQPRLLQRHSHTIDCDVVGYTGSAARPHSVEVRDDR
jgi:hypothetical protein